MSIEPTHIGIGTTSGGAATAVISGLTINDIGVYVGIAGVVVGLVIQWYFGIERKRLAVEQRRLAAEQAQRDAEQAQRDAEYHAARMANLPK